MKSELLDEVNNMFSLLGISQTLPGKNNVITLYVSCDKLCLYTFSTRDNYLSITGYTKGINNEWDSFSISRMVNYRPGTALCIKRIKTEHIGMECRGTLYINDSLFDGFLSHLPNGSYTMSEQNIIDAFSSINVPVNLAPPAPGLVELIDDDHDELSDDEFEAFAICSIS